MSGTRAPVLSVAEAAREIVAALDRAERAAVVTIVSGPSSEPLGRRLLVTLGSAIGHLGIPELEERAQELARECLETGERELHPVTVGGDVWELYVESHVPRPDLIIVGAGHIAQPLCRIAAMIGFRVTVLDDRQEFARDERFPEAARVIVMNPDDPFRAVPVGADTYIVLVTRAHKYDYDCLRHLLNAGLRPAYVGMIGSRRRVRAVFEALLRDGIDPGQLETLRAPIGLDIGAETPQEIAVSIAGELIQHRRGGSGAMLAEREDLLGRVKRKQERGHHGRS
ncbi:MAG: XdhC family protein [Gemmatimonadetes bacterium]|nr:XdhC family protein [Gemmatimonadota bacterium]